MKKLVLVLSLVLMLTFVGCSSKTTVKETDAFRFDSKTGYAYSTAPFGIDTTEFESAIGSKLTMVSESPATAPFAYTNYSSEDIVQSSDSLRAARQKSILKPQANASPKPSAHLPFKTTTVPALNISSGRIKAVARRWGLHIPISARPIRP